jgi:hypothetical protein
MVSPIWPWRSKFNYGLSIPLMLASGSLASPSVVCRPKYLQPYSVAISDLDGDGRPRVGRGELLSFKYGCSVFA